MDAASRRSYPGLSILILAGAIAALTGCVCIAVTVLRANAHLWPLVTEPGGFLPTHELANVYSTWYGAGIAILVLGFVVGTGAIAAKIRTAGRFTGWERGRIWVGLVGPVAVIVLTAGILALPVIVELQMHPVAHASALAAAKMRERATAELETIQQRRNAAAEANAAELGKQIDALTSPDPSVRQDAIRQLNANFELARPNPTEPYASLRGRLLTTIDQHWRTICTSDRIASDLNILYSRLDRLGARAFVTAWQAERMTLLDPHDPDWKRSLTVADDPPHLQALNRYCQQVDKSVIATDRTALMLFGQAVNRSAYKSAEILLDAGMPADTVTDGMGGTPLKVACDRGPTGDSGELLKLLLAHGANPQRPPPHAAAESKLYQSATATRKP